MKLNKQDLQVVKHAIQMLKNHEDMDEIGKYLDDHSDVADALAQDDAIYTSSIFIDKMNKLIENDLYAGYSTYDTYNYVSRDADRASAIYSKYDHPLVQGSHRDISLPSDACIDSSFHGEVTVTVLFHDLHHIVTSLEGALI